MLPVINRLLRIFFVTFLACLVAIHVKPLALLVGSALAAVALGRPRLKYSLVGLMIPLAALAGPGALILPILAVVGSTPPRPLGFGGLFTGLLGVWTVADYALHFPVQSLIAHADLGYKELLRSLRTSPPSQFGTLSIFCTWFAGFEIFNLAQGERPIREQLCRGITTGLAVASIVFLVSLLTGWTLPHESGWWLMQGRRAATFSDPNAFGIAAFLGAIILYFQSKKHPSGWIFTALVGLSLLSLFSGSRSALLGQALFWGSEVLFWWINTRRKRRGAFGPLVALILASGLVGGLIAGLSSFGIASAQRLQFGDLSSFINSLQSRLIFWRVGAEVFFDYPVIGVGLNRFGDLFVPYANSLGLGTGIWTDNPNSFYLWLLVELGLVGCAIFAFELTRLKAREDAPFRLTWLPIFCLLLVFGPHLHFLEVSLMTAVLLAVSFQVRRPSRALVILSLLIMPFVGFAVGAKTLSEPIGLYPWENNGESFRWTAKEGRFDVVVKEPRVRITFKVPNPSNADLIDGLSLRCGSNTPLVITPRAGVTTTVSLSCPKSGLNTVFFALKADWIPARVIPGSTDYRALGMMLLAAPADHVGR